MNLTSASAAVPPTLPGMLRPLERRSRLVAVSALLLLAVVVFGAFLAKSRVVTAWDLGVDANLSRAHVVPITDVALAIYTLFSPTGAIALTVVVALVIWAASRSWRVALTFSVVVGASWLSSDVVKILVHRPRPDPSALTHPFLPTPPDASFPSGHVVFAASLAVALMFLARTTARVVAVAVVGTVGTILVGFAVVYLGVHYPTDVIASIVWGIAACPLVLALWNRFVIPRTSRSGLSTIAG